MPQSSYRTIVYPPIQDVDEYRRELIHHRASWENDERDKHRNEATLDIGDVLVGHCDLLEKKSLTWRSTSTFSVALCQRW